jgi:hypothetical protein
MDSYFRVKIYHGKPLKKQKKFGNIRNNHIPSATIMAVAKAKNRL